MMLLKLERQFVLRGIVQSYLCDRTVGVIYNGSTSRIIQVTCSVPQGSLLGPRMFIVYTADLEKKVDHEHG